MYVQHVKYFVLPEVKSLHHKTNC